MRLCDLITRASGGRLTFNRFASGVIVADAIYEQLEPRLAAGEPTISTARYTLVPPPFESFWIEAKSAAKAGAWVGAAASAFYLTKDREQRRRLSRAISGLLGATSEDGQLTEGWILNLYPVTVYERGGGRLMVLHGGVTQKLFIDSTGQLTTPNPILQPAPKLHHQWETALGAKTPQVEVIADTAALVLEVLALLNCVNVRAEPVEPVAAMSRSHAKKYGVPLSTYKILTVKRKEQDVNLSETRATYQGGHHAPPRQHLVRGHFKRRGEKMYWWSAHLRGRPELGGVAKTYLIETTNKEKKS